MKKLLVVLLSLVAVITFFSCNNTPVVEVVQAPTADPESSAVAVDTKVTLECATSGAEILYTTNVEEDPATPYDGPIPITTATNIKAVAKKAGCKDSDVEYFYYTIKTAAATPFFKCNGDVVVDRKVISGKVAVELTSTTPAAKIYYTTDGSKPTDESALYSTPIYVEDFVVIKAVAVADGYFDSGVSMCSFEPEGESPDVKYEIKTDDVNKDPSKATKTVRLYTCVDEYTDADAVPIYYSLDKGETWEKYSKDSLKNIDRDIKVLAYAEKEDCKKSETVEFICGPDEIKMGVDGCIHVHFGEPQPVKVSTASVGSETYVEYATCESAFPVLKDLPSVTSTFRNFVKMLALVSNDYDEDDSGEYVAQDFILSLSGEGSVLDLLKAVMESVFGGVVTVQFNGDALVVLSTEGVALVNIPIKGVKLNGVIPFSPYQWDGLAISPIYVTKDLYGLVMDLLTQNLGHIWKNKKGETVTPLTTFTITNESGETIVEKNFPKLSARVQYFVNSNHTVTFAKEFYDYDSLTDRIAFTNDYKVKLKTTTDISIEVTNGKLDDSNCFFTTISDGLFERKSYGVERYGEAFSSDKSSSRCIVLRTEYLTTKTNTDVPEGYYAAAKAIVIETNNTTVKTGLDKDVNYLVAMMTKTGGASEPSITDLFYVTAEENVHKLAEGKLNPDKNVVVIATGDQNITGYCNHITCVSRQID